MNRLFQHYEGVVDEIIGYKLKELKILFHYEPNNNDVILLWLRTEYNWLRVFIDGVYCGIDEYLKDESIEDQDDEVLFVEFNDVVKGTEIKYAVVESEDLPIISLMIELSNETQLILDCKKDEVCSLRVNSNNEIKTLGNNL